MSERVVPFELGVRWEPGSPDAVLVSSDFLGTVLAMAAHPDDPDQRCVVLVWTHARFASMSPPNDEAISGHRLYSKGLKEAPWAGFVEDSSLIEALETQNRVHPYHDPTMFDGLVHHVIRLKESVVEVVAWSVEVERVRGATPDAAIAALRSY